MSRKDRRRNHEKRKEIGSVETNASLPEQTGVPAYTFDLISEEGPVFSPHLLEPADLPEMGSPAIRELVNLTAEGKPIPPDLKTRLGQESGEEIFQGIKEGISRWHTLGKERG